MGDERAMCFHCTGATCELDDRKQRKDLAIIAMLCVRVRVHVRRAWKGKGDACLDTVKRLQFLKLIDCTWISDSVRASRSFCIARVGLESLKLQAASLRPYRVRPSLPDDVGKEKIIFHRLRSSSSHGAILWQQTSPAHRPLIARTSPAHRPL